MSGEGAEVRCPWNRGGGDPQRKCGGWEGNVPTVICEACDSLRTTWLTRLLSEEHEGFSRRQLLGILNRHKSYAACRQIIRIVHQHRAADKDISEEEAAAILARSAHFQAPCVQAQSNHFASTPCNQPHSCPWFLTLTDGKYQRNSARVPAEPQKRARPHAYTHKCLPCMRTSPPSPTVLTAASQNA